MRTAPVDLRALSPVGRAERVAASARALDAGELQILPSETGYVCVSRSIDAIAHLAPAPARIPIRLFASVADAERAAELTPAQARLVRRLSPGPAIYVLPDVDSAFWIPSADLIHRVATLATSELFCVELDARTADEAGAAIEVRGSSPDAILNDGSPSLSQPATVLSLPTIGGPTILRKGAYEERFIDKASTIVLLFVCTGNTCRSPMAEAIARSLLEDAGVRAQARSAGVGASHGAPPSPEALMALDTLGVAHPSGGSTPLTPELVAGADHVFAMTAGHLRRVLELAPEAQAKAILLDVHGRDIPDPIGRPPEDYLATANRIRDALNERLKEIIE